MKHKQSNSGEKPFKCDLCQKTFRQLAHLTCHKLSYTEEKSFKCDLCENTFAQLSTLKDIN